jgi:hypothetical protein
MDIVVVPDLETGLNRFHMERWTRLSPIWQPQTYFIEKQGITNLRVGGEIDYSFALAFASRKDWPELNSILEKGLASITEKKERRFPENGSWLLIKRNQWPGRQS